MYQQQQQQQGLPAQGMQMGHIPPLNQQQNQMMMQQRQRQHHTQTQQTHAPQQIQPAQNPQPQQQTQQHHIQDTVRLQMQKQMMQSRGHPPNYPMSQAQSINNAMNQRGMMPNVSLNFLIHYYYDMTNWWIVFFYLNF